jgi:hypothetical protein
VALDARFRGHDHSRDEVMDEVAAKRARLAELERELARLRYRHDIAMSAFRFEEATALGPAIAALDKEQQALAAGLPPAEAEPGPVIPVLRRRGRGPRRR